MVIDMIDTIDTLKKCPKYAVNRPIRALLSHGQPTTNQQHKGQFKSKAWGTPPLCSILLMHSA